MLNLFKVGDDVGFKLLNELGNILRKHNNIPMAIDYYRKAL